MGRIGFFEIVFILCVIVLLFGVKRLPEIGKTIGKTIRQFRQAVKEVDDDSSAGTKEDKQE